MLPPYFVVSVVCVCFFSLSFLSLFFPSSLLGFVQDENKKRRTFMRQSVSHFMTPDSGVESLFLLSVGHDDSVPMR